MKTMPLSNKCIIILWLLLLSHLLSFGQDNRWNIKLGHSRNYNGRRGHNGMQKSSDVTLEVNYLFSSIFESGLYFEAAKNSLHFLTGNYLTPTFGINLNTHLLPLLLEDSPDRLNLFISAKFGGTYVAPSSISFKHRIYWEYGAGLGLSYYIWRHVGLYVDYSFGNFNSNIVFSDKSFWDYDQLKYGITIKF